MGGASLWGGTKNSNIWNGDAGVGNVGIGTTAPNAKLNLPANSEILIGVGSSSDGLGISYINAELRMPIYVHIIIMIVPSCMS
jgi:hypothetical protein